MSKTKAPQSPFDAPAPRVFSIDAGRPFLDDLAEGLIDALGDKLPTAEIFLPTRRAARHAADRIAAAYDRRGVSAALLPSLRTIGDIEADELLAFAGDAEEEIDIAPAVDPAERLLTLAAFAAAAERAFAGQERAAGAVAAARQLAMLLDSLYTEEIDPAALRALQVNDLAGHWARSLKFLSVVIDEWPAYLAKIGRTDPAARRAALIGAAARRIASAPPAHPIIIAGTTASAPGVARLVAAIAAAPYGAAILPGVDRALDAQALSVLDDAHPQAGLKALLDKLGVAPADVAPWPGSGGADARARLLTLALRPAAATDDWVRLVTEMTKRDDKLAASSAGVALVDADNEEEEATIIAAIFRETIESPGRTALLVTPDRLLARRVALKMRRWGIDVEDSAGVPFANTPCGVFLRLVARFLDDPGDPVAALALLRHPLAQFGMADKERARAVDALDRALRGVRPAHGLASIAAASDERRDIGDAARAIISLLTVAADDFAAARGEGFAVQLGAHVAAAERIAGEALLWAGPDGAKGGELLADLADAGEPPGDAATRYTEIFEALIAGVAVRGARAAHPRLAILGPLEARLLSADHVVLGGLNEGVWPSDASGDPFLSRQMRKDLGLPSPERRVGLSAHDFAGLAAQPRVTLTRARRAGGSPAKPSRWIVRLRNILAAGGALEAVDQSRAWGEIARRLDAPNELTPATRPRPKGGPGRRPSQVSVTRVEKWLRDPYAIYAHYLLRLRKLDDPGIDFGARDMGRLLHKVFEIAATAPAAPSPANLRAIYDEYAPEFGLGAADRRFWSEAVATSFDWFAGFERERRAQGRLGLAEGETLWLVPGIDPPLTLTAIADRIDILADGAAALFDYKTGAPRTEKQEKAFSPQLSLTAAMIEAGAFTEIGARAVERYAYLRIANRKADEKQNAWGREGPEVVEAARNAVAMLQALIAKFDGPGGVYQSQPRPEFLDDYGDFDQLARRREWSVAEGGDGGDGE